MSSEATSPPAEYTILVGFAIGWSDNQPRVTSYTSTEVLGDATATQPNLWMLEWKRSIDDAAGVPFS